MMRTVFDHRPMSLNGFLVRSLNALDGKLQRIWISELTVTVVVSYCIATANRIGVRFWSCVPSCRCALLEKACVNVPDL